MQYLEMEEGDGDEKENADDGENHDNDSDDSSPDENSRPGKGVKQAPKTKKQIFYRWKVGQAELEFELPPYYNEVNEATFRGNGLFW